MGTARKAAVIGLDSISLNPLLQFVDRGVMPDVARLSPSPPGPDFLD